MDAAWMEAGGAVDPPIPVVVIEGAGRGVGRQYGGDARELTTTIRPPTTTTTIVRLGDDDRRVAIHPHHHLLLAQLRVVLDLIAQVDRVPLNAWFAGVGSHFRHQDGIAQTIRSISEGSVVASLEHAAIGIGAPVPVIAFDRVAEAEAVE